MRSPAVRWGILGLVLLLNRPAEAENARLPYHYLCRIQKVQTELCQAHPDLQITLQLQSVSPNVKNSDLQAYLDSKSGKIPVSIGPEGEFQLPLQPDLETEDPWLLTNQPKGTMQLNWQAGLSKAFVRQMTNSIHYAALMRAMRDCQDAQAKMRECLPDSPKLTVAGLKLIFSREAKSAALLFHTKSGERKLDADSDGELIVPLDQALLQEDPLVTFSVPPAKVQVVSRKSEE
jgi:hypothetical protein